MKPRIFILLPALFISLHSMAQIDKLNKQLGNAGNAINQVTGNQGSGASLSNDEVVKGLKEALDVGTKKAVEKVSAVNGFYKNPEIKIPFPPKAKKMETTLRQMGMGSQVDKFTETLNRAAEDAAKSVTPVFVAAITGMSITDGMSILKGSDNAATEYLRNKTTAELSAKIKPIVAASLQKVQITKYWNPLAKKYNSLPTVQKVNPDLEQYVTERALEGLFRMLAKEELSIRKDPLARVTDLLKKVFGIL
jgi:hypothetical protein